MINMTPGSDQQQFIDFTRTFLASKLPVDRLFRRGIEMQQETDTWTAITEMGWFGMGVPDSSGGLGLSIAEEALIFREVGRYLLSPNVVATRLACHAAHCAGDMQLLNALLGGEARASVGLLKPGVVLEEKRVNGNILLLDAHKSQYICLWNEAGLAVLNSGELKSQQDVKSTDWSSTIQRSDASELKPAIWIPTNVKPLSLEATVLGASILVGIAEGSLELAVEYAKVREQFGKPIGAFQAIKHRCADMALRTETAWAQTIYAALSLTEGYTTSAYESHAARILAADAAIKNGEANIQVHGGIGFTEEAKPHLFLKRAHTYNHVGGNIRFHQHELIALNSLETATT